MNSLKHILHVIIDLCFWLILLLVCYIDAINVGVSLFYDIPIKSLWFDSSLTAFILYGLFSLCFGIWLTFKFISDDESEESQPTIDPQSQPQTESQPQVSPQIESQPQVSPQIESQPQVSPQTESQPHVSPQTKSQPQVSPQIETFAVSEKKMPHTRQTTGKKIDWEAINAHNKQIGAEGEEIVVNLEKQHLRERGKHDLCNNVRNIAKDHGDGFGYDVLSYFPSGEKKYIEVKSSSNNFSSGFIMTHNEVFYSYVALNS